jgi:hypothetical protein
LPPNVSIVSSAPQVGARKNKYGNVKTKVNGVTIDSKKEARHYQALLLQKAGGAIRGFVRQVSILLPSGRRLRLDFVVVENDGRVRWQDVKGYISPTWAVKRAEAESALGIQIETL